jgi:hypothetical protein
MAKLCCGIPARIMADVMVRRRSLSSSKVCFDNVITSLGFFKKEGQSNSYVDYEKMSFNSSFRTISRG